GDFSYEKFSEVYTADLANGLGNLCSRVAKLCEKNAEPLNQKLPDSFAVEYQTLLDNFEIDAAVSWLKNQYLDTLDQDLATKKPWTLSGSEQTVILQAAVETILLAAYHLQPFLPETAKKI